MKENILTLPNLLSFFRLFLIPLIFFLFYFLKIYWAFFFLFLAFFSDILDGYFARKLKQETNFGKIFDPVVDRLLVIFLFLVFILKFHFPFWVAFLVIFCNLIVFVVTSLGYFFFKREKIKFSPTWWGRGIYFFQILTLIFFLLNFYPFLFVFLLIFLTFLALIFYIRRALFIYSQIKKDKIL